MDMDLSLDIPLTLTLSLGERELVVTQVHNGMEATRINRICIRR